jgi:hypothetical protein
MINKKCIAQWEHYTFQKFLFHQRLPKPFFQLSLLSRNSMASKTLEKVIYGTLAKRSLALSNKPVFSGTQLQPHH